MDPIFASKVTLLTIDQISKNYNFLPKFWFYGTFILITLKLCTNFLDYRNVLDFKETEFPFL